MASWWILLLIIELSKRATCDYQCTMKSFEVTCSGINNDQLSQKVTVTLNKTDVLSLNLTNSVISTISENTFKDFTNLETLQITGCEVSNLEDNAFYYSLDLKHLYLNNNLLTNFNVRSLPMENVLNVLDLSYNQLNNISDFNIYYFPKLTVLNVANNFLTYLPINLLIKLKEQNQFYLVADNNPWNCNDSNWSEYLTVNLINAFCSNKTFDYTPEFIKLESKTEESQVTSQELNISEITTEDTANIGVNHLQPFIKERELENKDTDVQNNVLAQTDQNNDQTCEKPNCLKCSFSFCLLWFLSGIWIGIILGNVGKIRSLICSRSVEYTDHSTQCEQPMADQFMVSGFHLDFNSQRRDRRVAATHSTTKPKDKPGPI